MDYDEKKEIELLIKRFNRNKFYGDIKFYDRIGNEVTMARDLFYEKKYEISMAFTDLFVRYFYVKKNNSLCRLLKNAHKYLDKWEADHTKGRGK
jgi:hypothetical protein